MAEKPACYFLVSFEPFFRPLLFFFDLVVEKESLTRMLSISSPLPAVTIPEVTSNF